MDSNSISLVYENIKSLIATQQNQKASLENKASMLMAFAGGMFALLMGARESILLTPLVSQYCVLLGVSLFAISVILTIVVTWVRSYRIDPDPETLAKEFIDKSPDETKLQLIANLIGAWKENSILIERNANVLRITFVLQALAFLSLGTALFLSLF